MAEIVKPPKKLELESKSKSIFLAGSIEMGTAENWQEMIEKELKDVEVTIYNPRRDDWDSSGEQSIDNDKFREQVEWELDYLESVDVIVLYFDPNTKSPISLLELGLFARSNKMVVYCTQEFWRKGNVDIVCEKYNTTQVSSMKELVAVVRNKLLHTGMELDEIFEYGQKVRRIPTGKVYDFGYVGGTGKAIIYNEGEHNMQDSYAINFDKVEAV